MRGSSSSGNVRYGNHGYAADDVSYGGAFDDARPYDSNRNNNVNVRNSSAPKQMGDQEALARRMGKFWKRGLRNPLFDVTLALIIFVLVFMRSFLVPSESMVPTLQVGDRLFSIARYFPNDHTYAKGDIVCFQAPSGDVYVKRVVAQGGDKVEIVGDTLYVNGEKSPYQGTGTGLVQKSWNVPEGYYFMMGDNRGNSQDSRFIGCIAANKVISRVVAVYWPINRFTVF